MIDIESMVFAFIAEKVREKYPGIYLTGEYGKSPPSFPCASIMEVDNQVWKNGRDTSEIENFAQISYEVNAYSNKTSGKKAECKAIIGYIDEQMKTLGFTRTMLNPVPNMADATIYRMTARYRAIISKDHVIFRR